MQGDLARTCCKCRREIDNEVSPHESHTNPSSRCRNIQIFNGTNYDVIPLPEAESYSETSYFFSACVCCRCSGPSIMQLRDHRKRTYIHANLLPYNLCWQWRIQGGFWLPGNPPGNFVLNQGVTALLAPTFTSHLDLRFLETPLETNSGYATSWLQYVSRMVIESNMYK